VSVPSVSPTDPIALVSDPGPPPAESVSSRHGQVLAILLRNKAATIGLIVIAVTALVAILAGVLAPHSPVAQSGPVYHPPSARWPLGTDDGGVDVLSQLIYGARVSMIVGLAGAGVSIVIGGTVGILAGFAGGKTDTILMRITDYFLVIPDVPLMIVFAAIFGRSLTNIVIIIGIIYWTSTARLIRAQVKTVRERAYVHRARSLGAGSGRLIGRHILPQVAPLLVANTVLMVATAIFAQTYVAFLGLGDPSQASWGQMIQNSLTGGAIFHDAWWAVVPPGLAVTVIVLACTMVGQALEDELNPRLRTGHLSVRRFRVVPFSARLHRDD
jgi:peptide/nickel transport system permease protein